MNNAPPIHAEAFEAVNTGYLAALNPEQRAAVLATDGPVLVLAGAGTGKTRVLTTRIAHILHQRLAFSGQILAVTFTNKAAREMTSRVASLLDPEGLAEADRRSVVPGWLGTFHSIAAKILRRHAERVGLTSSFTILDDDDQMRLIKALLAERNIDEKAHPPKLVHAIIQSWKDKGLRPEKVGTSESMAREGMDVRSLYAAYQQRLKSINCVDFGDLLLHNLTLFSDFPEILKEIGQRFKYILVDEYQDTNTAQYLWLRLLALAHGNICCVGDDDQSIYGWRGAEIDNILRFEHDFPGAQVIRLERNYRSTSHILAAASGLIANNAGRLGKTLWTEAEGGDKVRLKSTWDGDEEARFVGEEVEALQRAKAALDDIAILVRASFQTRAFEERFLTLGVPYRVVGGLRFYERAEIRDTVAYLRVIAHPEDDLAFERIINIPKRGIGKATLEKIHSTARERGVPLTAAVLLLLEAKEFTGKLGAALGALMVSLARWRKLSETQAIADLTEIMLEESGYRAMWQADKSPEAAGRLENLKELTRAMGEFENLTAFLEHVGLVSDMEGNTSGDMLSLMTLHAAKGLEFNYVFLPGWEEGLFPHQRSLDEKGTRGLEEERRLAYVGITRARKQLWISHAANRRVYNQWQSSIPSRFIGELPGEHIDDLGGGAYGNRGRVGRDWKAEAQAILAMAEAGSYGFCSKELPAPRPVSGSVSTVKTTKGYSAGARIFHIKFGYGRIVGTEGDHLDIEFEKAGRKKVLADYVEMAG